ncbi:MAG: hypothetical protein Kow00129_13740 [Thermoleophilia bacterium]
MRRTAASRHGSDNGFKRNASVGRGFTFVAAIVNLLVFLLLIVGTQFPASLEALEKWCGSLGVHPELTPLTPLVLAIVGLLGAAFFFEHPKASLGMIAFSGAVHLYLVVWAATDSENGLALIGFVAWAVPMSLYIFAGAILALTIIWERAGGDQVSLL